MQDKRKSKKRKSSRGATHKKRSSFPELLRACWLEPRFQMLHQGENQDSHRWWTQPCKSSGQCPTRKRRSYLSLRGQASCQRAPTLILLDKELIKSITTHQRSTSWRSEHCTPTQFEILMLWYKSKRGEHLSVSAPPVGKGHWRAWRQYPEPTRKTPNWARETQAKYAQTRRRLSKERPWAP